MIGVAHRQEGEMIDARNNIDEIDDEGGGWEMKTVGSSGFWAGPDSWRV